MLNYVKSCCQNEIGKLIIITNFVGQLPRLSKLGISNYRVFNSRELWQNAMTTGILKWRGMSLELNEYHLNYTLLLFIALNMWTNLFTRPFLVIRAHHKVDVTINPETCRQNFNFIDNGINFKAGTLDTLTNGGLITANIPPENIRLRYLTKYNWF